uniref:RNA-directed DNA polymerase n=1 Tax=Strongyloides papillosus TaxID=174720 RepID=A0A0N5BYM8_STREA
MTENFDEEKPEVKNEIHIVLDKETRLQELERKLEEKLADLERREENIKKMENEVSRLSKLYSEKIGNFQSSIDLDKSSLSGINHQQNAYANQISTSKEPAMSMLRTQEPGGTPMLRNKRPVFNTLLSTLTSLPNENQTPYKSVLRTQNLNNCLSEIRSEIPRSMETETIKSYIDEIQNPRHQSTPIFKNSHEETKKKTLFANSFTAGYQMKQFTLEPFKGKEMFASYLTRFEAMLNINMVPESLFTATLIMHLESLPAEKVNMVFNIYSPYNKIVDFLLEQFKGTESVESAKQELRSLCNVKIEKIIDVAKRIDKLVDTAYARESIDDRLIKKRKYLADLIKSPNVANAIEYQSSGETFEITIWKARNMLDRELKSNIINRGNGRPKGREKCNHCGYTNHKSEDCRKVNHGLNRSNFKRDNYNKQSKQEVNNILESNNIITDMCEDSSSHLRIITVAINNLIKVKALFDTGSTKTLIPKNLATKIGILSDLSKPITLKTLSFGKSLSAMKTKMPLNFKFDKQSLTKKVYITDVSLDDRSYDCIIGWDLIKRLNVYEKFIKNAKIDDEVNVVVKESVPKNCKFLDDLKFEYSDVFAISEFDLGEGLISCSEIELKPGGVFKKPIHYPIPESFMSQFKHYLNELENAGVLIKMDTIYTHPCIILQKENNILRMISDMRSINNMVVPHYHAAPTFKEILGKLNSSKYFTKLDSPNAFFQISVLPNSVKYLGIRTPFGTYCYQRMPQGFLNSSSEYQRLCENMLKNIDGVINYIDDIVVYGGDNEEEHFEIVKKVLQCFRQNKLKLSFDKSTFCGSKIQYLGYEICSLGSKPARKNIEKFLSRKKPVSKGEMKSLLASSNYFRQHIVSYSKIIYPLEEALSQKYKRLNWTSDMEESYKLLLSTMNGDNFMRHPNFNVPFNLITDASQFSIGAIVTQIGPDNKEYLVSTYSKRFRPGKTEQSATWRELVGVVKSFKHYRSWFVGNLVNIKTDHGPLVGIFSHTDDPRYIGQIAQMQGFHYNISHLKGAHNPADYISRYILTPTTNTFSCPQQYTLDTFIQPEVRNLHYVSNTDDSDSCLESDNSLSSTTTSSIIDNIIVIENNAITRAQKLQNSSDINAIKRKRGRPKKQLATNTTNVPSKSIENDNVNPIDAPQYKVINESQKRRGRPPKSKYIPDDIIDVNEPSLENFSNFSENKGVDSDDLNLHEVFEITHNSGHPGLDKMVELIQLRLPNVENLRGKIAKYLSTCLTCKLRNSGMKRVPPPEAIDQYDCPGQCYSMDIMGKIKPPSDNGDCYVVSVIDNYSRAITLFSLKNYDAETLIPILHKKVFMIRGYPKDIKTDNGTNFVCSKFKKFLQNLNINHITSNAFHSRGNSQCERSFKTISDIIAKICRRLPTTWADTLEAVQFYVNSTISKSTGVSPFYAEHRRHPNTLLDQMLKTYSSGVHDTSKSLFDLYKHSAIIREEIYQCLKETRTEENSKLPFKPVLKFNAGDEFFIRSSDKDSNKFGYRYDGPHKVIRDCGTFLIYKIGNLERTVHKQNVKRN